MVVAIEYPRMMAGREAAARGGALSKLALQIGCLVGSLADPSAYETCHVHLIYPEQWKGQLTKEITRDRVIKELRTTNPDWNHDVIDAIGLGLWCLGRFE